MSKYQKKPVVIHASQFTPHGTAGEMFMEFPVNTDDKGPHLLIPTLEGDMRADPGDWIITGVKGEKYPCKPDIFEMSYVAVVEGGGMNFGLALEALKLGKRVARAGWNGKGMFLFLLPANDGIPTKVIHDPALRQVIETETGKDTFDALGSIRMWTADKKVLTGWLASQTDMLSDDWQIIE